MNTLLHIVLGVLLGMGLLVAGTVFFCKRAARKMLHPTAKRKALYLWPDELDLPYEKATFYTSDGVELKGWFIPAPGASHKTIVLMHGWGMNRSDVLKRTYFLRDMGFNLFYFDFRALGESGSTLSSIGYLERNDVRAALDYLQKNYPTFCEKIGLYGISMGGMVAISEAARNPRVSCVAAEATYYSFRRVVSRWAWVHYRVPYFPLIPIILHYVRRQLGANPERYSPKYTISKIAPRPVFLIHGRRDHLVPAVQARRLFSKAGDPRKLWLVPGAKHDKCGEVGGFEYKQRLADFFRTNL